MNNLSTKPTENLYESIYVVDMLDSSSIQYAKEAFQRYKEKGVIRDSEFDDERWQLHDEYSNVGIRFNFPKLAYKRHLEPILGIMLSDFILYQKAYIVNVLGTRVLSTLQKATNDTKKFIKNYQDSVLGNHYNYTAPYQLIEFLEILPSKNEEKKEEILLCLEELVELNNTGYIYNRRSLSQFQSYFLFDKLLNQF